VVPCLGGFGVARPKLCSILNTVLQRDIGAGATHWIRSQAGLPITNLHFTFRNKLGKNLRWWIYDTVAPLTTSREKLPGFKRPRQLYPRGKSPRYPLDRFGGPQRQSGRRGEEKNSWPYQDSNSDPSVVQPVSSSYTDYAIPTSNCDRISIIRNGWIYAYFIGVTYRHKSKAFQLGLLAACSKSKLTSETRNLLDVWQDSLDGIGPSQDLYLRRKTQIEKKRSDVHTCTERNSNPGPQVSSSPRQYKPRTGSPAYWRFWTLKDAHARTESKLDWVPASGFPLVMFGM
jgi:hypothetical protein